MWEKADYQATGRSTDGSVGSNGSAVPKLEAAPSDVSMASGERVTVAITTEHQGPFLEGFPDKKSRVSQLLCKRLVFSQETINAMPYFR